jgi:predicted nucleic acid-binding protein
VTNLLTCDALIAEYVNKGECYDIVTFDFQRAFDKVPHQRLIRSLHGLGLHERSIK